VKRERPRADERARDCACVNARRGQSSIAHAFERAGDGTTAEAEAIDRITRARSSRSYRRASLESSRVIDRHCIHAHESRDASRLDASVGVCGARMMDRARADAFGTTRARARPHADARRARATLDRATRERGIGRAVRVERADEGAIDRRRGGVFDRESVTTQRFRATSWRALGRALALVRAT